MVSVRKRFTSQRADEILSGSVLVIPAFAILAVFTLYPVIRAFVISFQDYNFLNPASRHWVGFENYVHLFHDPVFLAALRNTVILLVTVVPVQSVLGFLLAVILNEKLRARGLFRTLYFLPYISPPVAVAAIIGELFTMNGPMTVLMRHLFGTTDFPWYASRPYAFILVAVIAIWSQTGFYMILFLSGLQSIPAELYEAARMDGANRLQAMLQITVPMLKPTTFLVFIMGIIATLQIFDVPYMVSSIGGGTPGGPGNLTQTLVMYLYTQAFTNFNMGAAAAAAFIVFASVFVLTMVQYMYFREPD